MPRRPRDPGVPYSPIEYFGAELRARREMSNLSRPQLAARLGYSPQRIGQIESGGSAPSEVFAQDCDAFFNANGTFHRIWKWIQDVDKLQVLPPGFPDFIERERKADGMYIFEASMITGLFQTPEYAYEVLKTGRAKEEVEQLVATRLERQEILQRDDAPRLVVVLDEAALRRPFGGSEVMGRQIEHLIEVAQLPNVTLQLVALSRGAYAGVMGAFTIFEFNEEQAVAYVEGHLGGQMIDHVSAVRGFAVRFDLIRGAAMSDDDSLRLLRAMLESP
ncbi:helix-turn-helix domain-containing protein [Actinomadura sp. KC06]|uniref:helix-turn-helix domain-containing protein n=1 Tax=Actinomadura sp. KC06 TaxID=2530369 RepID=UPI00104991AB|nr:helix-turn-helix transcriptional regulator [Actinomadura sp. KC06]TDD40537.1 helix-turn-helix domain-containing protein [Actinomadura sp. KC06]